MSSRLGTATRIALGVAALIAVAALGFAFGRHERRPAETSTKEKLANTANVITAVRGLARLETVAYHMERIIDLTNRDPHLFGLIHTDDSIMLVAAGDVIAGVDLARMKDGDVSLSLKQNVRSVRLRMPPPEVLSARLDNDHTYVHSRKTDLLARRGDQLETRARQLAEHSIRDAALEAGILDRARQGAEQTLSTLVRTLGYDRAEFEWEKSE